MLIGACALPGHAFARTDLSRPTFADVACQLPNVTPEIAPRLRCGTIDVPRDYADPTAGRFTLAVVVVRSATKPAAPDPVVYISGGPGSPLTIYTDYQARHPYAPNRDLILVDQRGTGRSEPKLCPDLTSRMLATDIAVFQAASQEALAHRRAAYMACRDEMVARGISPVDFSTQATAQDFDRVRQALGVTIWNVFGESYGTTVAMTLAATHPGTLRSLVLDSVYPPGPLPARSAISAAAREAFFAECARQPDCASSFPDLAGTYVRTLTRLRDHPLPVVVPSQLRQTNNPLTLTETLFEAIVDNLIYYPRNYPGLPSLIEAVHDGDTGGLGPIMESLAAEAVALDRSVNAAVECRDRPQLRKPPVAGSDPQDLWHLSAVCADWSPLGPPPVIPAGTTVPTLVLAGAFDPVAGPTLSRHVADIIGPHAHWIEFPRIGHNVRSFSPCAAGIVSRFITDPDAPPDTACPAGRPPIPFGVKSETR